MSRSFRKERRKFFISVEGESCEKQYFEHLQRLINDCPASKYNVNFVIKAKVTPRQMLKRYGSMPVDKDAQGKPIPYMHVADIENYYDLGFRKHFFDLLDEMKVIKKGPGKAYLMGYSNLTFDLWMLLHVNDMNGAVTDRDRYLEQINQYFHKSSASQIIMNILTELKNGQTTLFGSGFQDRGIHYKETKWF